MKLTAQHVEIAVAKHFDFRRNLIVPNVYWGLGLRYEADLVVLRPTGWAIEVEIKVSASDIIADTRKSVQHNSPLFRQLYFAVPEALQDHPAIPERAGILGIHENQYGLRVRQVRPAKIRRDARKWDSQTRQKLMELAAMRIWSLKLHLSRRNNEPVRQEQ